MYREYDDFEGDGRGRRGNRGRGWGMRHGHRHGRGRGRGGKARRPLAHGDLRLLLLSLIATQPRHGYELIREIEAKTEGAYVPSPGVVYPALETLLDLGWARAEADGSRRSFTITDDGWAALSEAEETLKQINERLSGLAESDQPDDPQDVRGAMHRLRHTLFSTVRRNRSDPERLKAITEILTEANDRISKLD